MYHVLCSFFVKQQTTEVTQSPYSPDLAPCKLLAFLKTKIPFEREEISDIDEIQENAMGQMMVILTKDFAECFEQWKRRWENCVKSQGAYFEGA